MYANVLYSLQTPKSGECLQGLSREDEQLVVTCPLTSVHLIEFNRGRAAYQCVTRHGTHYLVYVLPPEADLSVKDLHVLRRLTQLPDRTLSGCHQRPCECLERDGRVSETVQLRRLLWWLGILSVFLGSQTTIGENLWSLFLEVVKILLKP